MEQYRTRMVVGTALMALGFVAELVMLAGVFTADRPPAATWALLLLIGVGSVVLCSAFVASARDRRDRTRSVQTNGEATARRG